MKTSFGLLSALMVATSLMAQTVTNQPVPAPPEISAPAPDSTNTPAASAPAKKSAPKKRAAKKPAVNKKVAELKSVPLVPGPAVVVVSNLNVRGQAKLNSEVVARLTKGAVVTVLEEITLKHSAPDEPSAWAKISLPSDAKVWSSTLFLDANRVVTARKLNLRAGPGENYSVLGLLMRGDTVKELAAKGDWIEIEPPTNAYAFVAAQYLRQLPAEAPVSPPVVVSPPAPEVAAAKPAPETPKEVPPPQPTETPAPSQPKPETAVAAAPTPTPPAPIVSAPAATEPAKAAPEEPAPPRIVQREGIVRGTGSIQAPSRFELVNPENKKTVNYLYNPSPALDLRRWKGLHVMVSGEEGLDERWPNTPVLTIQKIEVLDEP